MSSPSSDLLDSLICHETKQDHVTIYEASLITVQTWDVIIKQIENYSGVKIFFTSSDSLVKSMVPKIVCQYLHVHSSSWLSSSTYFIEQEKSNLTFDEPNKCIRIF